MSYLTEKNIEFISRKINGSNIELNEMREDLIDHFCCAIEEDMKKGSSFDKAYDKSYQNICPDGFDEIQRETIFLLTYKKIKTMKQVLYLSAYLSAASIIITTYLSLTHNPASAIALMVSALILLVLFIPSFFLNQYKRELSKTISNKLMFIFGFFGIAIFLISVVFKISHWPGAKVLFLASIAIVNLVYFPFLFFKMYRKSIS
jgi:hypothetical protein